MLGLICAAGRAGPVVWDCVRFAEGGSLVVAQTWASGRGAEAEDEWRGWVKTSFC